MHCFGGLQEIKKLNTTKKRLKKDIAMGNEFIFTAAFAVLWVSSAVIMLMTALWYKYGKRKADTKSESSVQDTLYCICFLWALFGVATFVAYVIELLNQLK